MIRTSLFLEVIDWPFKLSRRLWSSHWPPSGLSSRFIILQTQMLFKLPFIAAVFTLPLSASASASQLEVSLPLPNVVVFSDKHDEFFTRIVSTPLALISSCSFLLLRCISRFRLTVSWILPCMKNWGKKDLFWTTWTEYLLTLPLRKFCYTRSRQCFYTINDTFILDFSRDESFQNTYGSSWKVQRCKPTH